MANHLQASFENEEGILSQPPLETGESARVIQFPEDISAASQKIEHSNQIAERINELREHIATDLRKKFEKQKSKFQAVLNERNGWSKKQLALDEKNKLLAELGVSPEPMSEMDELGYQNFAEKYNQKAREILVDEVLAIDISKYQDSYPEIDINNILTDEVMFLMPDILRYMLLETKEETLGLSPQEQSYLDQSSRIVGVKAKFLNSLTATEEPLAA